MKFHKLALAAAVAAAPASALAMEPMEDTALSGVTGQDGISINIDDGAGLGMDVIIHDTDGVADDTAAPAFNNFAGYTNAGAIIMDGMNVNAGAGGIDIDIDAGSDATGAGNNLLNVNVSFPGGASIQTGVLRVGGSARDNTAWGVDEASVGAGTQVASNTTISLGNGTELNIQLGDEPQGNMITVASTITGGITLSNLALTDASSSQNLGASSVTILDNGGANLTLALGIDATATGLALDFSNQGAMDLRIVDAYLGGTTAVPGTNVIGDVEVIGLDLSSTTVTVSGK